MPQPAAWLPPMLAVLGGPPAGKGWRYEPKLDGLRCIAVRNGEEVELWSRNRLSYSSRFPHVVAALRRLPATTFTLDGELVALVEGVARFGTLQQPGSAVAASLAVFDVLHLLGRDVRHLPLEDRRRLVSQLLGEDGADGALVVVPALEGDPEALLAAACARGDEGIVAKRVGSPYVAGRSSAWVKCKCTRRQELVIGGWTPPRGARAGFGALVVGYYDDQGALRCAGKVGTGFSAQGLRDLSAALSALEVPSTPFVDAPRMVGARWVRPELVVEVEFGEWTGGGRLRHPRFLGLRPDKAPTEVVREDPPSTLDQ